MAKNSNSNEPWHAVDQPFETDDDDLCPLCMEELDVSDLNFRPCPCGYRICRFCWHHIKEDLNRRCPGCRKEYDDSVVEFKPMKAEELKRLQQAKKQRDKERKDLELTNRKHLANVRVKQKNQVHVQGLTTKIANEDTLAQLKTSELFSSYGRILKMFMSRRTGPTSLHTPDSRYQHVNLYINFAKNTEALACINGLDGITLPDGHRVKATLGSTKYCASFLRGLKCMNDNCTGAHELAEEVENGGSAAREEMSTARHAQKESEHRVFSSKHHLTHSHHSSSSNQVMSIPSGVALPATASWANKSSSNSQPASPAPHLLSLQNQPLGSSPSAKLSLRATPASFKATTHPLPARPPQNTPYGPKHKLMGEGSSPPIGSLPDNQPIEAGNSTFASCASDPDTDDPPRRATPKDKDIHQKSDDPLSASSSDFSAPPTDSVPTASVSVTSLHPPGLPPPPGLNAPPPPGLSVVSSGTSSQGLVPSSSLPPGLVPSSAAEFDSLPWHGAFDVTVALESKFAQATSLGSSKDKDDKVDILSTFSPNFTITSRSSIFNPSDDPFYCVPGTTLSTSYSGTFDPFADTDILSLDQPQEVDSRQRAAGDDPLIPRRGSRFGFARRESGLGAGLNAEGPSSSPLRSIFSHSGDAAGPSNQHHPASASRSAMAIGRTDRSTHLATNNISGESTPDASVLFPGVNLAASYSANALPAALARGMKSPGTSATRSSINTPPTSFQSITPSAHLRDVMIGSYERPNDRLPPAFNPRATATSPTYPHPHPSNHHEHLLRSDHARDRRADSNSGPFNLSQYSITNGDMGHEFQDPAILNMRMANNGAGPYAPPLMPSSSSNQHEIYPPFSMNAGFHNVIGSANARPHPFANQTGGNQDLLGHYGFPSLHPLSNPPGRVQPHSYYGVGSQGLMSGNVQRDSQRHR
ncbi:hypothetical protein CROQUDRAFT_660872 [Cronartium quercuum f. sp. fusiforme G11]|uniref:CCR4-NOT transcription complex subunit 4 n=1 Tax=Cronartium quercuum f. sp. fusiforme G11 TaxID=708437 RepID=A0A9P6NDP4_9BASI|nr:hypothetical protein CROQUDRAFT_660872 [Cronartium quercuum f. sp. fusiforme G11]